MLTMVLVGILVCALVAAARAKVFKVGCVGLVVGLVCFVGLLSVHMASH